jgi:hypothetical protein
MRLALLLAALLILASPLPAEASHIKIILRYDDYSHASDTEIERALFEAASDLECGVLVGVIPFDESVAYPPGSHEVPILAAFHERKVALLREYASRGVVEIAVHGFAHTNNAASGPKSEFAGLGGESQDHLVTAGMAHLESTFGSKVGSFIPPYNHYDDQTLKSLAGSGYTLISAGPGGPIHHDSGLAYLPRGPQPSRLEDVVAAAVASGHTDATLVLTIHEYDIAKPGSADGTTGMAMHELVDSLHRVNGIDEVRFISTSELLESEDLSPARMQANRKIRESFITRHRLLPARLNAYPVADLYYSQQSANRIYLVQLSAFAVHYGALVLALTLLAWGVLRGVSGYVKGAAVLLGGASLTGIVAMLTNTLPSEFFLPLAVVASCCLGITVGGAIGGQEPTDGAAY